MSYSVNVHSVYAYTFSTRKHEIGRCERDWERQTFGTSGKASTTWISKAGVQGSTTVLTRTYTDLSGMYTWG